MDYWTESAARSAAIASLEEAFAAIGFEPCDGGGVEPGFEKIVLYENKVNGHVLPCKLPAACGAAKWAPGLSLNTKIQSRYLVSYTETQRSTCDERRLPVVPPAPSELDLMQHNSPRMRIPFGVCRPTAKLQDKIGRNLSLLAPILA